MIATVFILSSLQERRSEKHLRVGCGCVEEYESQLPLSIRAGLALGERCLSLSGQIEATTKARALRTEF